MVRLLRWIGFLVTVALRALLGAAGASTDGGGGGSGFPYDEVHGEWDPATTGDETISYPAGTSSGDLLLLFVVSSYDSRSISTPSGWTLYDTAAYVQNGKILWRTASTESDVTLSMSGTDALQLYTLVNAGTGWDATPLLVATDTTSDNSTSTIAGDTKNNGDPWFWQFAYGDESVTSASTDADGTDILEVVNQRHSQSDGAIRKPGQIICFGDTATTGIEPTMTLDANSYKFAQRLATDPA